MKACSFDNDTCREVVSECFSEAMVQKLEREARKFADNGFPLRTRFKNLYSENYWCAVLAYMKYVIWKTAYFKRLERIKRMKQNFGGTQKQ